MQVEPKTKILAQAVSRYDNFSKSNMAVVATLDFWENCPYHIYDPVLDVLIGVENIGVDSNNMSPCWSSAEI